MIGVGQLDSQMMAENQSKLSFKPDVLREWVNLLCIHSETIIGSED